MEGQEIQMPEILECSSVEMVINEAVSNDLDIINCRFKGCYEAHIDTYNIEFNKCEFIGTICLNDLIKLLFQM